MSISININAQNDASFIPEIIGTWISENKKQKIKVSYDDKSKLYVGHVAWMFEDDSANGRVLLDKNNPNIQLKSRRVTGIPMIYQLKLKNKNKFKGFIYDPISGKEYRCILTLGADKKSVEIRGYIPDIRKNNKSRCIFRICVFMI